MKRVKAVRPAKRKYKGFLHVKCPRCGRVRSFCKKVPGSYIRCKCGWNFELRDLVPIWVSCECGMRSLRYLTNRDERIFDIGCLNCGAPVCVEWNPKKHVYVRVKNKD